jgi:hypothetical protein
MVKKVGEGRNIAVSAQVRKTLQASGERLSDIAEHVKSGVQKIRAFVSIPSVAGKKMFIDAVLAGHHKSKLDAAAKIKDPALREQAIEYANKDLQIILARMAKAEAEFVGTYKLPDGEQAKAQERILNRHFEREPKFKSLAGDYFRAKLLIANIK